jgi:hypothetical protein
MNYSRAGYWREETDEKFTNLSCIHQEINASKFVSASDKRRDK